MSVISEDTVKGSFHQGDPLHFSENTLGHQCMANAVAAAVYATMLPVHLWTQPVLDCILNAGDALYTRRCNSLYQYLQFLDIHDTEVMFGQEYVINPNAPMTGLLEYEIAPSPPFLGGLSLHLNHLYSIAHDNLRLAIWDTSFWTFLVKLGHKGP